MENERVLIATDRATLREVLAEIMKPDTITATQPDFEADRITAAQGAEFAGVSYATFCSRINNGRVPVHGQGRTRFLLKSELVEALRNMK